MWLNVRLHHRITGTYVTPVLFVLNYVLTKTVCQPEVCLKVPSYVEDCYAESANHPIDPVSARVNCLQRLLWHYDAVQNITSRDRMYFSDISHHRGEPRPRTGYRIRKEYRQMSDNERRQLHGAFNTLYDRGLIKRYAGLYAEAIPTIHNSPHFLAWHRIFLAYFEEELRIVDSSISLPYWDSSLDHDMDNPVNSILWSSEFLGNANGDIVMGPFSGWLTARGSLWRQYSHHQRGLLLSKDVIRDILTRCHTTVDVGANEGNHTLEHHHRGVLNWLGGDVADGLFSAYDPVFYLHIAFIDMIWEKFRRHQRSSCHVDPVTDFQAAGKGADDAGDLYKTMLGFEGHRYIDSLQNFWTVTWYGYADQSECPDCKSKYLYCDQVINRCVSHSRRTDYNSGKYRPSSSSSSVGIYWEPFEPETTLIQKRVAHAYAHAPLSDGRTHATAERDARRKEEARKAVLDQPHEAESDAKLAGIPIIISGEPIGSLWTRNIQFLDRSSHAERKFISLF